jgi:hypothetical protein
MIRKFDNFSNSFLIFDMLLKMITAKKIMGVLISNQKILLINYLKTTFFFDLLANCSIIVDPFNKYMLYNFQILRLLRIIEVSN